MTKSNNHASATPLKERSPLAERELRTTPDLLLHTGDITKSVLGITKDRHIRKQGHLADVDSSLEDRS